MEPSLNVQFRNLTGEIGRFLGYGKGLDNGATVWTTDQQDDVDRCVQGGMRKFYHCGYSWSFLHPPVSLTLTSGVATVDLPDDYGGFEGQMTVLSSGSSVQPWKIEWRSEAGIRGYYSENPSATGAPAFVAEYPLKGTGHTRSERWQLIFYPLPDQAYTIQGRYSVNPNYLSGLLPYAYGGQQHAETLLEACSSVAELIKDDLQEGPHFMEFMRLLEVSKELDRKKKPQGLGYNGDNSDQQEWGGRRHWQYPAMTYNGSSMG